MRRMRNSVALVALTGLSLLSALPAEPWSHPRLDPEALSGGLGADVCALLTQAAPGFGDLDPDRHSSLDELVGSREPGLTLGRRAPVEAPDDRHPIDRERVRGSSPMSVRAEAARVSALEILPLLFQAKLGRLAAPSTAPPSFQS